MDQARRAWDALADGDLGEADILATALVRRAVDHDLFHVSSDEHSAHLILGHVHLRRGDPDTAEYHLLAAARVDPDPSLRSFGPNMSLAHALLQHGRTEAVIGYLDLCSSLWKGRMARRSVERWRDEIADGHIPDFGPNLIYGTGERGYVPDASQ
jgi:hypothetical protein